MDLLFGEKRLYSLLADDYVELYSLSKKHFLNIFFYEFRTIGSEMYRNALKRKIRTIETHKNAVEFCHNHKHSKILKKNKRSSIRKKFKVHLTKVTQNLPEINIEDLNKFQGFTF